MKAEKKNTTAGTVLLFVLGILALLSILGTALIFITRHEEAESQRYVDESRAQFAAESGVEFAFAKLMDPKIPLVDMPAWMACQPAGALPIDYLQKSSFGSLDVNGDGMNEIAGTISETYAANGDNFKLRVQSAQSKLNINDTNSPLNIDTDPYEDQRTPERDYSSIPEHLRNKGHSYPHNDADRNDPGKDRDPDWIYPEESGLYNVGDAIIQGKPYPKAPGRLENILAELMRVLFPSLAPETPASAAQNLMRARKRLGGKFQNMDEVRNILCPAYLDAQQSRLLESHLTLSSWQDKNVLIPTFQWRINTPPVIDLTQPDRAPTQHMLDFPGDCSDGFAEGLCFTQATDPIKRPGSNHAGLRGADMMDEVAYDFDGDRSIEDWEHYRHDRDIYMFSDMQTRYFATEARSPINVNDCSLELLEALIAPIQGWYLQEAPATWRGEDIRARAEDWSQSMRGVLYQFHFPWFFCTRVGIRTLKEDGMTYGPRRWDAWHWGLADESQYYYYDSYAKDYFNSRVTVTNDIWDWRNCFQYAEKNARFGELQSTLSLSGISSLPANLKISKLLAWAIYNRIHADTNNDGVIDSFNPFQTWEEFEEFIVDLSDMETGDTLHLTGNPADFDIYMAHAVLANFNPNARLNDFNPDKNAFRHLDKSQLMGFSSELCFQPLGEISIESLGQIMSPNENSRATFSIACTAKHMEVFRISSQAEFMKGYVQTNASTFLSASNEVCPTAGAKFTNGMVAPGDFRGYALQSYPETEISGANYITDSLFDGSLKLATLKPELIDFYAEAAGNNVFLANFNNGLNASFALGNPDCLIDEDDGTWAVDRWRFRLWDNVEGMGYPLGFGGWEWSGIYPDLTAQLPANRPNHRPLCKSLQYLFSGENSLDAPGHLHPDGVLSDTGRTPKFLSENNIGDSSIEEAQTGIINAAAASWPAVIAPHVSAEAEAVAGRRGSVQFWIKPNFDVSHSNRIRNFFTCPPRKGDGDPNYEEPWPYIPPMDYLGADDQLRDFSLYYFARGGRRVVSNPDTGRLDDSFFASYHPNPEYCDGGRWLPTRSLFLWAGKQTWCYAGPPTGYSPDPFQPEDCPGLGSSSVNQSWREAQDLPSTGYPKYNMESRQWSHIGISWNWLGNFAGVGMGYAYGNYTPPDRYFKMEINGKLVEELREQRPAEDPMPYFNGNYINSNSPWGNNSCGFFASSSYMFNDGLYKQTTGFNNYFALGETSSAWWRNNVADATYDNFVSSKAVHDDFALCLDYGYGRYYSENDAVYTSPNFALFLETQNSATALTLHSIAWTGYWPLPANPDAKPNHPRINDNFNPGNSDEYMNIAGQIPTSFKYNPKNLPDPMAGKWGNPWAPFSVDIFDPAATVWRYEDAGTNKVDMPNFAGGSMDPDWQSKPLRWEKSKSQNLRFRVHFNIAEGQTLYTSPVFDDITFVFSMNQPQILFWENARLR